MPLVKTAIKYVLQKLLGIQRYLYWFSRYKIKTFRKDKKESAYFNFLNEIKDEDGVFLDVGANIGVTSYHAAKMYPNTEVFSFEPIPLNLSILQKIVKRYHLNNVTIVPKALSDKKGELTMVLPKEQNVTLHGLAHVVHESMEKFNEGDNYTVEAVSLDAWISEQNISTIKGIKLDVENFEFVVLQGANRILTEIRPVIFTELWDNQNRNDCFDMFTSHNYKVTVASESGLVDYNPSVHSTQNFIMLPLERKA